MVNTFSFRIHGLMRVGKREPIFYATIEHLIVMKTDTGRGKDAIDIEELRKIQAGYPSC